MAKKLVSIVVPAKDEGETIGTLLDDINREVKRLKRWRFEIIVVDNNCADRTAAIAKRKKAAVVKERKRGKGHALVAGFRKSKGDYIVMLDADYSHRAEDLGPMIRALEKGHGLVVATRLIGGSDEYDVVRYIGNLGLTTCYRFLFWQWHMTDALNGFKAFRRDVFERFTYHSSNFEIEIELLSNALKLGYTVGEVPSHERARAGGEMKSFAPVHGTKFLLKIIQESIKYWSCRITGKYA